jgi:hypothetical protein
MKFLAPLALALGLCVSSAAHAAVTPDGKGFGIGVQGGSPSAVTIKVMTSDYTGLVFGLGGAVGLYFDPTFGLSLHVDHVWHAPFVSGSALNLSGYLGVGAQGVFFADYKGQPLGFGYFTGPSNVAALARVPIGLSLAFNGLPLELYLEADPALVVFPYVGFGVGGAVGARLWF